jgi:hypothetical protein
MLLITKGISDWDGKSHPIRGFGIDLWHAVEFSRYERARIFPNFVGPFSGRDTKLSHLSVSGQIRSQEIKFGNDWYCSMKPRPLLGLLQIRSTL